MSKIGILNSGGDCPGLNTVIDAVVKSLYKDYQILGFYKGYEGLLAMDYLELSPSLATPYKFQGGTFLKSVNKGNFAAKTGVGQKSGIDPDVIRQTVQNYHKLGLEGLIALGGDGSLTVAEELQKEGLKIIAVPKSIDNDLYGTEFTFGFQTAVSIATEALDRLETTSFSHDRVMILEVMGRLTGWIALHSGIAGGANVILLPEIPYSPQKVADFLMNRGKKNSLIVIAEGCTEIGGELNIRRDLGKNAEVNLGGAGDKLCDFLNSFPGIESRSTSLGHIQRGGSPNAIDRILSQLYGSYVAQLFKEQKFGKMVAYKNGKVCDIEIKEAVAKLKKVDPKSSLVKTARNLGICFGD